MDEIFYHVFQRSFFDSNQDSHGDLKGLQQKLPYIASLGVTSILILPLYESPFYHNYFANDFRKIDEKYGTLDDYIALIDAIHSMGMKLYLDMEVQYVAEDHIWFKESYADPTSTYTQHILYNGPNNTEPESIIFDLKEVHSYNGEVKKVACLNLFNPETQKLILDEFKFWLDPHEDGSFRSAVDGFRLDHMMDDLDDKGKQVNVYRKFWKPIIDEIKNIDSKIKFIGEQANWESHGEKAFIDANVDYMFAFPLKFAISDLDKERIIWAQMDGVENTPEDKAQVLMIENHDTNRFASIVKGNPGLLRVGAALNILLKGFPAIYYGQELGMKGEGGFQAYGISDGNDIPRREAFPWKEELESEGVALWYKESGPWWEDSELRNNAGMSLEAQENDPSSLLHFYRNLIFLRKSHIALQKGDIEFLENRNPYVISFIRRYLDSTLLVNINLSGQEQAFLHGQFERKKLLFQYALTEREKVDLATLAEYGIEVFTVVGDRTKHES